MLKAVEKFAGFPLRILRSLPIAERAEPMIAADGNGDQRGLFTAAVRAVADELALAMVELKILFFPADP